MVYVQHIPSPPLNRYIECLFYMEGWVPVRHEKVPPTPALNLQINLGDAFHMVEVDRESDPIALAESWLGGLYGVHHRVDWTPYLRLYGVRFYPNGVHPFLEFPLSDIYNQIVPLDAVWGHWVAELRERLHAAPSFQAGLLLLERVLRERLHETPKTTDEQNIVQCAIAAIRRDHGMVSIREVSDYIGISQNHLGTLFKRVVGTSAKELARLYLISTRNLSRLPGRVQRTICPCAAMTIANPHPLIPIPSASAQLIEFLQAIGLTFLYDSDSMEFKRMLYGRKRQIITDG